ncbi:glycosyltransferase family 2 protein [Pedobacter mucosus]|uniref:glycosyltransferase family 2 protein n=1 Tax=Pedobacter mucosus TaxID=2895286 RepID=UPI001EE43D14|nr:glycosyltransferase family 2 protein [Pedobacter mucosus]UKT62402.1 glycosyltransferase family 2 protein [Pedobacter mucosus]
MKIAVLLACFNRKEKTLSCLESVYTQDLPKNVELTVYLTDDNSSDGTREAVAERYPKVKVFKGSGSLFWAGGMRNSWTNALAAPTDYFFLLNDDTILEKNAISRLLDHYKKPSSVSSIAVGSTFDSENQVISYGGIKLYNQKKVHYHSVYSEVETIECDMSNANIMLVPTEIVQKIGILSDKYTHSIADLDYTLRANKAGFKVALVPGILGSCADDHGNNWKSSNSSLRERINYLKSPKGLAYKEYLGFIKTHFPSHVPEAFVKLWLKTLFPVLWDKFKK